MNEVGCGASKFLRVYNLFSFFTALFLSSQLQFHFRSTAVSLFSLAGVLGATTFHATSISLDMHEKLQGPSKVGQVSAEDRASSARTHVPQGNNPTCQGPASPLQMLTHSQNGIATVWGFRKHQFVSNPLKGGNIQFFRGVGMLSVAF